MGTLSVYQAGLRRHLLDQGMFTLLPANLPMLETGKPMPPLQGEFLSGKKAVLPDAAKGKVAMYLVGFSYDSRFAVEAWAERYKKNFASNPAITFYEVPVIRGMRNGSPKQFHDNVLTMYGGAGDLRKAFGATNDKFTVVVLCDRQGLVQWTWAGLADESK